MRPAPLQPIHIGRLRLDWPVFLAPMAGYTDGAFRSLCLEHGCGVVVTEMASSQGMKRNPVRTERVLDVWGGENPIGAQIYGSDPAVMAAAAARVVELGRFDFVDINAGCPMPKIQNRGDGAGLMRTPELMAEIVRQVKAAVGDRLPVTLKTRIGWCPDSINVMETTAGAEEAGADAIFLHGRVASVRHSGDSNWELLAAVKRARRVPVIGNGGLKAPADVFRMLHETGVDGVMVGRAALGNPWWFHDVQALADGQTPEIPPADDVRRTIRAHLRRSIELLSRRPRRELKNDADLTACMLIRPHLVRYLRGFVGFREMVRTLEERVRSDVLLERIDAVLATGRRPRP